jgi:phosphinothricin acetyltransferase
MLLEAIVNEAEAHGMHTLVGAIDLDNSASMELHKRLGFEHCGTIRQAGFKFGRWLDVAFLQKTLATPLQPVDG